MKEFQPGDEIFGDIWGCGHGGFAEYAAVPENRLVLKSAGILFEEAAAVPIAAITALQGIRKGQIQPGQKVLINGASGGVGTYYRRALTPKGTLVVTGGSLAQVFQSMFLGPLISLIGSKKMMNMGVAKPNKEDLTFLKELLEAGKVKPVLDRCYTLAEVPDALRYFGEGHARGKVVITVEHNNKN